MTLSGVSELPLLNDGKVLLLLYEGKLIIMAVWLDQRGCESSE